MPELSKAVLKEESCNSGMKLMKYYHHTSWKWIDLSQCCWLLFHKFQIQSKKYRGAKYFAVMH